jgi:hypothetical protein
MAWTQARYNMARKAYQSGQVHQLEPERAGTRILAAATAGNPYAQHMMGVMFLQGTGVDQDERSGAGWLQKAAEQGLARAQNDLGTLYAQGRGRRRSLPQARFWFRRAADQGLTAARDNLKQLQEHSRHPHLQASSATPSLPH